MSRAVAAPPKSDTVGWSDETLAPGVDRARGRQDGEQEARLLRSDGIASKGHRAVT